MLGFFTKKQGFTLIELLVVLAIVGLLASVLVVALGGPKKEAKDARRQMDIQQIMKAMDLCYDDSNCGAGAGKYLQKANFDEVKTSGIGEYLSAGAIPDDPQSGSHYIWVDNTGTGDNQKYCVYATLEVPSPITYYCASEEGVRSSTTTPDLEACCY